MRYINLHSTYLLTTARSGIKCLFVHSRSKVCIHPLHLFVTLRQKWQINYDVAIYPTKIDTQNTFSQPYKAYNHKKNYIFSGYWMSLKITATAAT